MRRMRRIRITKPLVVRRRSSADSPALHTLRAFARYLLVLGVCLLSFAVAEAFAEELDLEKLDGPTAIRMMEEGKLTSVRLTRAYRERIDALNKRGPGLNAVTQLNPDALKEAAILDRERAQGMIRGPAHGLPILVKDLIDVVGMYTSAGNYSLRENFPPEDSGIAKKLKASGVIILGKLGLSEFANSFGSQPSGFSCAVLGTGCTWPFASAKSDDTAKPAKAMPASATRAPNTSRSASGNFPTASAPPPFWTKRVIRATVLPSRVDW